MRILYTAAALTLALTTTLLSSGADATHRVVAEGQRAPAATVSLQVHQGSSGPNAKGGTWAWTPDSPPDLPIVLAFAPSRAAAKIAHLRVGDTLIASGDLAGTYIVLDDTFDGRHDHDLYAQVEGANGLVARYILERTG